MSSHHIRLVLVDDQRLFLEGLKYVIESRASDMKVVGTAQDGTEAISAVRELKPDIVLMDVRMPGMDGVEATREIHQSYRNTKIVMLTTFDDDEYVHQALNNGAIGYLLKNRPPMELINSIRAVKDGVLQIDPSVAEVLLHPNNDDSADHNELASRIPILTPREKDVLQLIVQAFDNRQIAEHLHVTEQTCRNYISSIYAKLGVSHRMQLVKAMNKIQSYLQRHDG